MGFERVAYRGLETGSRATASHVVRNGDVTFVLTSPLRGSGNSEQLSDEDRSLVDEIHAHLEKHGDAVKDVCFSVDDVDAVYSEAIRNGAIGKSVPKTFKDEFGWVTTATITTYGDTQHTLIERRNYSGVFMPGYRPENGKDASARYLPKVTLQAVDHCVGNQDWNEMESICE
jgi:4-hydroxyphenylpyruvate dioxygenase